MIKIQNQSYELIKEEKNGFDENAFEERYTDFFAAYDYIVGDWAYGKLRLKGFNDESNPQYNKINDASKIDAYLKNYCAYGCKYFILKKNKVE